MTDVLLGADQIQAITEQTATAEAEWFKTRPTPLPTDAVKILDGISGSLARVRQQVDAVLGLSATLDDKMVPREGRAQMVTDRLDQAEQDLNDTISRIDAGMHIAKGLLTAAALPKLTPGSELVARADAQMMMSASNREVTDVIRELGQRQDDVGALVTSSWGRDAVLARTGDPQLADAIHQIAIFMGVDAAMHSGDPARSAAARAVDALDQLAGVRDAANHAAFSAIAGMRHTVGKISR